MYVLEYLQEIQHTIYLHCLHKAGSGFGHNTSKHYALREQHTNLTVSTFFVFVANVCVCPYKYKSNSILANLNVLIYALSMEYSVGRRYLP